MAFRTEDMQTARGNDLVVFFVGLGLIAVINFIPLPGGNGVFISRVVPNGGGSVIHVGFDFSLRCAARLSKTLLYALLLGHEFRIAAQQNIGSAAGHVGGDGDHALASSLGNNFSLAFVIFRVQDYVLNTFFLE